MGMSGDGGLGSVGWVRMGARMGDGRHSCDQETVFVYLPASSFEHFESLWMGLGSSWGQIGFTLGTMAPN